MPEVILGVDPETVNSFTPFRELRNAEQRKVYDAIGTTLNHFFELESDLFVGGDSLVVLDNGKRTIFSYGIAESVVEK